MKILVAYDGSECSQAALRDLPRAGLPSDTEALVLSVVDSWYPPQVPHTDESLLPAIKEFHASVRADLDRARNEAEAAAARLRAMFPGWAVAAEACVDSPAWAIVKRAEGIEGSVGGKPVDLVVIGSHGYGGFKRFFLGSVSHKVVTESRCSVRIARGTDHDNSNAPPRLMVAVDGSTGSDAAVEAVAHRCWPDGTEVFVIAVASQAFLDVNLQSVPPPIKPGYGIDRGWAARTAEQAANRLRRRESLKITPLAYQGSPQQMLINEAENRQVDAIFLGARGLRAIGRFLLGSVSTAVAMKAHCTVEIVHAPHVSAG